MGRVRSFRQESNEPSEDKTRMKKVRNQPYFSYAIGSFLDNRFLCEANLIDGKNHNIITFVIVSENRCQRNLLRQEKK